MIQNQDQSEMRVFSQEEIAADQANEGGLSMEKNGGVINVNNFVKKNQQK